MKIESYTKMAGNLVDGLPQNAKNSLTNFNRVLNRMLQEPTAAARTATAADPTSPGAEPQSLLMRRMQGFLTMLEGFRAKLADSGTPLKELHPAAEKIQAEANALAGCLESLPAKSELAQSLKKTLTTASADLARFRNGSYLSQNTRAALANLAGTV